MLYPGRLVLSSQVTSSGIQTALSADTSGGHHGAVQVNDKGARRAVS